MVVWTETGELFTFAIGHGGSGSLGNRGEEDELVPRLVEVSITTAKMLREQADGVPTQLQLF